MQSRLRSKTLWISLITLIIFVLKTYFDIEIKEVDKLIELILITGTAFGIFNNPTDKNSF